jgi:nucleoside-diphosphate-sugar epimerase
MTHTPHTPSAGQLSVFVTGASGFLGQRIARTLVQSGHSVLGLARSSAAAKAIESTGTIVVDGDMNSIQNIDLHGIDVVVHAAAPVVFWGPWEMYHREVVDATLALYQHAAAQGVRRFVYISSESVMQGAAPLVDIDANQPYADPPNSFYGQSKKAAELALIAAYARTPGCEPILLRPTFIWAHDAPALTTLRDKMRKGEFVWIDQGRHPFEAVHVDNVALAVSAALTRGTPAKPYLVTDGQHYTARELLSALVQAGPQGVTPTARSLPAWLVLPLARALEGLWRTMGWWKTPPPVNVFEAAFLSQGRRYRINATRTELGYQPRAIDPRKD